jgi:hypothetical protein
VPLKQGIGLDHGRQLLSSAPMFRSLAAGRQQLAFLLPSVAPAKDSWNLNARAICDLSHAFPVWSAHPLNDLLLYSGAVSRFIVIAQALWWMGQTKWKTFLTQEGFMPRL